MTDDRGLVGRRNVAVWDEHRNTSRAFPVTVEDVLNAERASAQLRKDDPKLVAWLEAGAPPIRSEDEHVRWFGVPYAADAPTASTSTEYAAGGQMELGS